MNQKGSELGLSIEMSIDNVETFFTKKPNTLRKLELLMKDPSIQEYFRKRVFEPIQKQIEEGDLWVADILSDPERILEDIKLNIELDLMYKALMYYVKKGEEITDQLLSEEVTAVRIVLTMQDYKLCVFTMIEEELEQSIEDDEIPLEFLN